jgi:protein phosphatase
MTPMAPTVSSSRAAGDWLGSQQRYRLIEPLSLSADSQKPLEAQVTDTKPNDMASSLVEQRHSFALTSLEETESKQLFPLIAYPYLALHSRFFPSIPELQQAWIEPDHSVLIIEDVDTCPIYSPFGSRLP